MHVPKVNLCGDCLQGNFHYGSIFREKARTKNLGLIPKQADDQEAGPNERKQLILSKSGSMCDKGTVVDGNRGIVRRNKRRLGANGISGE